MRRRINKILSLVVIIISLSCIAGCRMVALLFSDPYPEYEEMLYQKDGTYKFRGVTYTELDNNYSFCNLGKDIQVGKMHCMYATMEAVTCSEFDIEQNILWQNNQPYLKEGFNYPKEEDMLINAIYNIAEMKVFEFQVPISIHQLFETPETQKTTNDYAKRTHDSKIILGLSNYEYLGCETEIYIVEDNIYIANYYNHDYILYQVMDEYQEIFKSAVKY